MSGYDQFAYNHLQCGRTYNDYAGLLIMYILVYWNHSWELILTILTDDRRKVTLLPIELINS